MARYRFGSDEVPDDAHFDVEAALQERHLIVQRGRARMEVLSAGGESFYCHLTGTRPALCAVKKNLGTFESADDGGGDPVWIVAGAALDIEDTVAVVRAFARGEPSPIPFAPGFVYWESSGEFIDWEGPRPRDLVWTLAVELDGPVKASVVASAVWTVLTVVTVATPDWLALLVAHPLPSLRSLRLLASAGTNGLQALVDAHPQLSTLWLDVEALGSLPLLSAPHVAHLLLEVEPNEPGEDDEDEDEDDRVGDERRQEVRARVSAWTLGEGAEIEVDTVSELAMSESDFVDY